MRSIERLVDSEAEIMKVIWQEGGEPITSAEIRKELHGKLSWSKSTVLTLIRRLVEKGVLKCEKKDVFYYTPLVSEEEYQNFQTRTFVDKIFDGNVKNLLTTLCQAKNLSRGDIEELQLFLKQEADKNV